jgi:hypothetical protein
LDRDIALTGVVQTLGALIIAGAIVYGDPRRPARRVRPSMVTLNARMSPSGSGIALVGSF